MQPSDIRELARLKPDMPAREIAAQAVADATPAQLREWAAAFVADYVTMVRRCDAHDTETAATYPADNEADDRFAAWLADPDRFWRIRNSNDRRHFRIWCGDRFPAWQQRARAAAEAATSRMPNALHLFDGDWHPDGPAAYDRQRRQVRIAEAMTEAVMKFAAEIRLETTRELLDSVFALGDGQRTTWGEATVAEHRQRISLLITGAAGTVETAARHQAAIRLIEEAGVSRLADLPVVGAADCTT